MPRISFIESIRQAQYEELARDPSVFLMGEDLVANVFGTTTGLIEEFGTDRIRDTPLSENGFVGAAAGASMVGARPIVDLTITSFVYVAMDQVCSIIAKSKYIYGGQVKLPLVLRMCMFYGNSNAAQHSDRNYPMFMGMPGLKIIIPSTPRFNTPDLSVINSPDAASISGTDDAIIAPINIPMKFKSKLIFF